ncbi:PBSX family phage terminase large subunit [Polymorphospora lycopeni]|uniref:Phage terminase large subunit n=1 Tax=Polymorphospora lycopeni TaxID=3140240 RepID=A0ABV5CKU1_9ACTN
MDLDRVTRALSPKQIQSIVEAQQTPQIALWTGAVSSGKTISSLIAFLIALSVAPSQGLVVAIGRTLQTIERNLIDPLQAPELFGFLAGQVHHTPGSTTAIILGRTVHLVGASDARAEARIRGATVALAYVDEATLVPHSFWMMLLSRLRVPNAKVFATTNPDGSSHWLRKEFMLRASEVGMRYWHFTLDDNPSLDPDYVERLKAQYVGLWYDRFIKGLWRLAEGSIYDMWDADRYIVDIIPPIWRWVAAGVDYGTSNPFVALLVGMDASQTLYVASEWRYESKLARRSLTDSEYSARVRAWLDGYHQPGLAAVGVRPEMIAVDPSAASFMQQLFRDGMSPQPAENAVADGIRTVSSLMAAGKLKVHRSCKGLLDELPGYSWDDAKAQRGIDAPIKVDDHSCDALRYAVATSESVWRRPNTADQIRHRIRDDGIDFATVAM